MPIGDPCRFNSDCGASDLVCSAGVCVESFDDQVVTTTVSVIATLGGSVFIRNGQTTGPAGRSIELEAAPDAGYVFTGFTTQNVPAAPAPTRTSVPTPVPTPVPTRTTIVGGGDPPETCNTSDDCNDPNVQVSLSERRLCIFGVCQDQSPNAT